MIFPLFLLLLLLFSGQVNAYADKQVCSGWGSWVRGAFYEDMNCVNYLFDDTACVMTIEPQTLTYLPGQEFTLHIKPKYDMGIKSVLLGGAEFLTKSQGASFKDSTCVNYDLRVESATLTLRAPMQGGEISIKALCGTIDSMFVADDIVMQPGAGVQPLPEEISEDPAFAMQRTLHPQVVLKYNRNDTHLQVAVEYDGVGYVGIGVGRMMVGSLVLVGMDPASNPSMNSVALYRQVKKKSSGQSELIKGDLFETAGVVAASYATLGRNRSMLSFTQLISKQIPEFTFAANGDIIWAVGPIKYGKHLACGTVLNMMFHQDRTEEEEEEKEAVVDVVERDALYGGFLCAVICFGVFALRQKKKSGLEEEDANPLEKALI